MPIYLSGPDAGLYWGAPTESASVTFDALKDPVNFLSAPLQIETEITGPLAATIFISSSTTDADIFVTLQAFAPDDREVEFQGTIDPHTPLAQGWLRASHRKLDFALSKVYRPYHSHDEIWPLEPGKIYELQVEIWPTCIVLPAGYRIGLQVGGRDFEREAPIDSNSSAGGWSSKGSGPFLHTHEDDRRESVFGGKTTIYTGGTATTSCKCHRFSLFTRPHVAHYYSAHISYEQYCQYSKMLLWRENS